MMVAPRNGIEVWKPVPEPEFAALYEVSSFGRVRSCHFDPPRIKAPGRNRDGYSVITLHNKGRRRLFVLHRMVCRVFNGPPNILHCEAAHLDNDRTNARADHLKWVSRGENCSHRWIHGTILSGEKHPRAKLTADKVRDIRRRAALGETTNMLAAEFGVSPYTIADIRQGLRWKEVA